MDVLEKPTEVRSDMRIRLEPRIYKRKRCADRRAPLQSLPGQTLFQDLNFEIKRGSASQSSETTEREKRRS